MAYQKLQASRALEVIKSDDVDIPNPSMLVADSTSTLTAGNKLVDSTQDFIAAGVKAGDIVYTGTTAVTVKAVDSAIQLDTAPITVSSGDAYQLYSQNTPSNGCVLYVGGAGDVDIITAAGDEVTLTGVLAGSFIPVQVTRVKDTSTTATGIIALW